MEGSMTVADSSERDQVPAVADGSERDQVPAVADSSERDQFPAVADSSERDQVPAVADSSERDQDPALADSSEKDQVPAVAHSSERDQVPAVADSSEKDQVPAVAHSSERDQVLVNPIITSSPKVNESEANGDHVAQIGNDVLPRIKFIPDAADSPKSASPTPTKQGLVDTDSQFESVKEACARFGGMVRWKSGRTQAILERLKVVGEKLEKLQEDMVVYKKRSADAEEVTAQLLKELENTNRQINELKLSLERGQTEEDQAKQGFELAMLRVAELEQGIDYEASAAAKEQLEVAKARHEAAVAELKSVQEELETLRKEYAIVVTERDIAVKKAEEALSESKEVEKKVEELTIELMATKEALESDQAAQSAAEEKRIAEAMARDQETSYWEKELKQIEEELQRHIHQINSAKDLQPKIDTASALLLDLKAELAAYVDSRHELEGLGQTSEKRTHADIPALVASAKKELEEMKLKIEKATAEVDSLKVLADSLKSDLEKEKSALDAIEQIQGMSMKINEKAARDSMVEAPKQLQRSAQEVVEAKSLAEMAHEELKKVKKEAEQAKATMEGKLLAVQKEIEAAKVSEESALAAMKAFEDSEYAQRTDYLDSQECVMLSLEEYYNLSKPAYETEEEASMRVSAAISQVEVAKQSLSSSLKKMEEFNREMDKRKELLNIALEKAEKAKEGKLRVERELRQWRADNEKQRKAIELSRAGNHSRASLEGKKQTKNVKYVPTSPSSTLDGPKGLYGNNTESESSPETTIVKKKALFPKIVSFFSRKKSSLFKSKSKTKSKAKSVVN